MKYFLYIIVNNLIMLLSSFLPKDDRLMIFGAWWGNKYDDNSRALFEYVINNRPDIKAYWISPNRNIVEKVRDLGYPSIYSRSLKAVYISLRAGFEIYSTSNLDVGNNLVKYLGRCTIVNLWHGVPIKKIMYDDHTTFQKKKLVDKINSAIESLTKPKWYVVCTSEYYHKIYQSAFRKESRFVLNLGQARNDYLFQNHFNNYRNIYVGKTIIVYMPTHRHEGKQEMDMNNVLNLAIINKLLNKHNAVLLIKKHYYHKKESLLDTTYKNIIELHNDRTDVPMLLSAADILISDYSSVFVDHLLLNKPQIFYCYDMEDYIMNDREMYVDYFSIVPGPICKNSNSLATELDKALSGNDGYVEKRQQALDFFYSKENRGIVAPRQLETILSLPK